VEALGERNFHSAFEVGCSIGVLTSMLATKCQSLFAVDVVESALVMARETCAALKHVKFENLQVPLAWPEEQKFDLIICSEVLYFLSPMDIEIVAKLVFESLLPGGNVLLVNYTEQIDEPCSGDGAAEIFIKSSHNYLAVQKQIRNKNFRIELLVTI
jgi:2-polyprenyl-3-methyl-5-hydroxy-6-metoxy-1,4-benzoquinol methylase